MNSYKLYSCFLGPKGENADILESLILEALRDCIFWRRNFHTEDEPLIPARVKKEELFQDSIALLQQEFLNLLANLKKDIPFYSPRYIGHMLGDQLLPAIAGYFATMLHNPNNVTREASPITTDYEIKVAQQLASLIGWEKNTWGHITSGGTIANFEALWVARNLKYFPIGAKKVAENPELEEIEIDTPGGKEKLASASNWILLNLETDRVLEIRAKLINACSKKNPSLSNKKAKEKIDSELANHTISGKGAHQFFKELDSNEVEPGKVLMPATAHYSLYKVVEALGLGKKQIVHIPVDEHFRMDIESLDASLQNCLDEHVPVIALISVLGSTEEGAVDYVHKIVKVQADFREKGLNFYHHCDAAFGGYVRSLFYDENQKKISDSGQIMKIVRIWPPDEIFNSLNSIYKADSVTIDPHKLGYIPYPAGVIVFRNEKVRDLLSFEAPYIFREEEEKEKPFLGRYILEGSKPGAAAAACWLAHKVVPLNQSGYGELIGKSIQSAQEFFLKCSKDLAPKLESRGIKLKVLTDPPDLNIFCFIVNKKDNSDLKEMNDLNQAIYNQLKFNPEEVIQSHSFIISCTDFKFDQYGKERRNGKNSMEEHLENVGIPADQFERVGKVRVLRCTIMSPWHALSRGGKPDYIKDFGSILEKKILEVAKKN